MAELAATVVGIVSFSLQICKGLTWYLDGVKNSKNRAEQISSEMDRLANLLELLETVIRVFDHHELLEATRVGIVACAEAVEVVRSKIQASSQCVGKPGAQKSFKERTKRLVYPFKEADLKHWKEVVTNTQQTLQTAFNALMM
jgi:hypothetical protein